MELPKEFKGTIYFYQNVRYGFMVVFIREHNDDPEYILLGTHDVDVSFDTDEESAVKQVVSNLKSEKKRIQADTQMKLNEIDDRINSLMAITYQS